MLHSRLFLRLFSTLLLILGLFSSAAYLFSVPLIEEKAYEIELDASRTILDNVFELVRTIRGGLEEQRALTVESYKSRMRDVVSLAMGYVDYVFARMDRGEITEAEARRLVYEGLKSFRYGNDDYVWVTDYRSVLLSHPDLSFQGRDASDLQDSAGRRILPTIIDIARRQGEGFFTYPWSRLNTAEPVPKISYFRDMPHRGIVIGTGAYMADIDAEVERRKAQAISDLREALRKIRIARTGYVYIFDAANNMIIHPNSNIEGTAFGKLLNPATGRPISEDLKVAAAQGEHLTYLWDKPSEPGNYAYEKISWVRHFDGFDWYIASSVYVEELRRSSTVLGNRILAIAVAIMLLGGGLGYAGARWLVRPLRRLSDTAAAVRAGNLDAETGIVRDDEIGTLAAAFDGMVRRLRDNIATLDTGVRERTAALEDSEARQRLILDAIPASIAYLDRGGHIRFANRRWAELVRRDTAAIIGEPLQPIIGRRAYAELLPHLERSWAGEEVTYDYSFPGADGRLWIVKTTLIPHVVADGAIAGQFVLSLDVTDEKETERQLMEAQRLKAVGQLAGGLAHDFNNLLSIILGNLAAARERYGAVDGLDEYLEPAQRASRRGAGITSRLLAFSRQHPLKPEPLEVRGLVRDVAAMCRRTLPESVELTVSEGARECWTIADQSQLENALVNLVLNARDAMPDGGHLSIDVGFCTVAEPLMLDEKVRPDEYLEIRVADTGQGFSPEAVARGFEPFFTTKRLGSGLGLSMVYGFVKQSHGYIHIDSKEGTGSVVTILLPRAEPAPLSFEAPEATAEFDARAGQLALVAEDNDDVRRVMREQLMDLGFSVVEAESGDEALALADQLEGLQLVVSDIVMPGISGRELARRLRASRPEVKVVLVSGFSVDTGPELADVDVLRKPWEKRDLIRAIHRPARD